MMSCVKYPLKCALFIINVLFWLVGGFMLYLGIQYIIANNGSLNQVNSWPAVVVLTASGVLIIGGVIGCFGTVFEKKSCLGVFLIFLGTVLIIQACIAGIMLSKRSVARNKFDDFLLKQFEEYGNGTSFDNSTNSNFDTTKFIDESQTSFECCGYNNYSDWQTPTWNFNNGTAGTDVPTSCCKPHNANSSQTCNGSIHQLDLIYTEGCKKAIEDVFYKTYDVLSWGALGIAILVFIGVLIVIGLLFHQRNRPLGYSHLDPQYTEA